MTDTNIQKEEPKATPPITAGALLCRIVGIAMVAIGTAGIGMNCTSWRSVAAFKLIYKAMTIKNAAQAAKATAFWGTYCYHVLLIPYIALVSFGALAILLSGGALNRKNYNGYALAGGWSGQKRLINACTATLVIGSALILTGIFAKTGAVGAIFWFFGFACVDLFAGGICLNKTKKAAAEGVKKLHPDPLLQDAIEEYSLPVRQDCDILKTIEDLESNDILPDEGGTTQMSKMMEEMRSEAAREATIRSAVETARRYRMEDAVIVKDIMDEFQLSESDAKTYVAASRT